MKRRRGGDSREDGSDDTTGPRGSSDDATITVTTMEDALVVTESVADTATAAVGRHHPWLGPFGREEIVMIQDLDPSWRRQDSTTFALGGFGELSIALRRRPQQDRSSRCTDRKAECEGGENDASISWSFVAVKTIENAVVPTAWGSSGGGRFGSQQQQQQPQLLQQAKQRSSSHQLSREVFNELVALRHLNPHPNIVPLVAVFSSSSPSSPHSLSLAFEYAPVDLHMVLEWRRRTFRPLLPFAIVKTVALDLLSGLAHCHRLGVLHRDLKPGNLLVSNAGRIQLCDFGLAKPFVAAAVRTTIRSEGDGGDHPITQPQPQAGESGSTKGLCTLHYRPPEVLLGGRASHPSVDVYGAGMVLAELVAGKALAGGVNVLDQLSLLYGMLGTPTDASWPGAKDMPDHGKLSFGTRAAQPWTVILPRAAESPPLMDLVSGLVVLDPMRRMTAEQALDHSWFEQQPQQQHQQEATSSSPSSSAIGGGAESSVRAATRRQVRDELIVPFALRVPPLLFPWDRTVASRMALNLARERRSLLTADACDWQGPTMSAPVTHAELCAKFQTTMNRHQQ
jgi:serine/threonine protein kinase